MTVLRTGARRFVVATATTVVLWSGTAVGVGVSPHRSSVATGGAEGGALTASSTQSGIYRATATFSSPPAVGHIIEPLSANPTGMARYHYVEREFFAAGVAHGLRAVSSPSNGRFKIVPTTAASYRTRILVRRPSNPKRFSGTVVVEWLNESAGESDPDWQFLDPALMASGDAYVGVSAQALGVEGGAPILGSIEGSGTGLVQQEPQRYGTLHHPGDQYALDIFAQIGLALRSTKAHVLGALRPRHVVAVGESQSAFYLTTFADALEPPTHAFDGIFIHSRGGGGEPLGGSSITGSTSGSLRIRTDLRVPVFVFETQTDLIELGYAAAQQPDTRHIRTWEIAGTSHADAYLVGGVASSLLGCTTPVNSGPQHIAAQAAFTAFVRWVVHGTPPPSPPPFRLRSRHPAALALDRYGNVVGGVRTPAVDVPISTLSGAGPPGASVICSLFGSTTSFSPAMLTRLYGTPATYVARYTADLDRAIAHGYILRADRSMLLAQARQVRF